MLVMGVVSRFSLSGFSGTPCENMLQCTRYTKTSGNREIREVRLVDRRSAQIRATTDDRRLSSQRFSKKDRKKHV